MKRGPALFSIQLVDNDFLSDQLLVEGFSHNF